MEEFLNDNNKGVYCCCNFSERLKNYIQNILTYSVIIPPDIVANDKVKKKLKNIAKVFDSHNKELSTTINNEENRVKDQMLKIHNYFNNINKSDGLKDCTLKSKFYDFIESLGEMKFLRDKDSEETSIDIFKSLAEEAKPSKSKSVTVSAFLGMDGNKLFSDLEEYTDAKPGSKKYFVGHEEIKKALDNFNESNMGKLVDIIDPNWR